MSLLDENIKKIATEAVENNNFFLIDFIARGNINARIYEIYIDGEKDISADDCAEISREINSALELIPEANTISRLDVSSPGVDRPLKYLKQYPKHVNRNFELSYKKNDETKKISAKLVRIEGEILVFSLKNQETEINFNNIIKAKVTVSFS